MKKSFEEGLQNSILIAAPLAGLLYSLSAVRSIGLACKFCYCSELVSWELTYAENAYSKAPAALNTS